jgi:drug/metabolite transporter (DMT)-like permease
LHSQINHARFRVVNSFSGYMAALAAALGWTISAACWTAAGRRVGSLVVNTIRLVLAIAVFMAYRAAAHGQLLPADVPHHAWLWLSLSGVTGYFICDLFLFRSMLLIGPRMALLIFSLAPIVSSLVGLWWLDERLTQRNVAGMAVALAGVIWVVLESPRKKDSDGNYYHFSLTGALFAFLAMISQGFAVVMSKVGMTELADPVAATHIRVIAGLICFLVLMAALGKLGKCAAVFKQPGTMGILTAGAIAGPVAGVALLMFALARIPCGLAMTFISFTPVMIIPFSIIIFRERVSPRAMLGALVACAGLAVMLL